jgi:hypothetical protein
VEAAKRVLTQLNVPYETTEVLLAEVPNHSGGFGNLCQRLATYHLNIGYAYCSFSGQGKAKGNVCAVIKVNDLSKARRVIGENGQARNKRLPMRRPMRIGSRT